MLVIPLQYKKESLTFHEHQGKRGIGINRVPAASFLGCRFDTGFLPDPASWPEESGTKRYQVTHQH